MGVWSQFYASKDLIFASKYNGVEQFAKSDHLSSGSLWEVFCELSVANQCLLGQLHSGHALVHEAEERSQVLYASVEMSVR